MRVLLLLLCSALVASSSGFLLAPSSKRPLSFDGAAGLSTQQRRWRRATTSTPSQISLHGSREEEIARLEETLRKLREEEGLSSEKDDVTMTVEEQKISRRLEMVKGKDMLLSESELIGDGIVENAGGESSNGLLSVAAAVVGLVLLVAFSQVPVGQESLSQYSATGSSTLKTIDLGDLNADAPKP